MKLVDRLRGAIQGFLTGPKPVRKRPTPEFLEQAQKELQLLHQQAQRPKFKPIVTVAHYAPVLETDLWHGDEYWHPEGTEYVDLHETIDYLAACRDQSLWFSVRNGLNYDHASTLDVVRWILEQPDCDAINAVLAFGVLSGPMFCGMPTLQDTPAVMKELAALKVIEAREQASKPYVAQLGPCREMLFRFGDPNQGDGRWLLMKAREEAARLKSGERPMLLIPEETLRSGGTGARNIVMYHVDEGGICVVPRGRDRGNQV
jgi:hypothetical protein